MKVLTNNDIDAVLEKLPLEHHWMLLLLAETGLNRTQADGIKNENLDFARNKILIDGREIDMSDRLRRALLARIAPTKSAASLMGSVKSALKTAAARENAKLPRPGAQGKKKPRKPKTV